jgi:hypothetical protein
MHITQQYEQLSQMLGVGSLRLTSAPTQTLPLDVNDTTLHNQATPQST